MEFFVIFITLLSLYVSWVLYRLGFHQRLPLALSTISLEHIADRAAKKYGERIVVTTDVPVQWCVKQETAPDDLKSWSANRVNDTMGYVSGMLIESFNLSRGDRVAIAKTNHFDYHILNASVVRAGGIACPMHADFHTHNVKPYINNIGAKILITDMTTLNRFMENDVEFGCVETIVMADDESKYSSSELNKINDVMSNKYATIKFCWIEHELSKITAPFDPIERGKDEPLYMTHTSGTTGFPKSVILKNAGQSHSVRGMLAFSALSRKDLSYLAIPFNHQAALATFNSLLLLGVKAHWSSKCKFDFNPTETLTTLSEGKFTGFFGFPITYTQLAAQDTDKYDLSSMRIWACTADACHEVIQRKFAKLGSFFKPFGLPISGSLFIDAQGSSEVGTPSLIRYVTTLTGTFGRRIGKTGSVPFGPKIKVVNSKGEPVAKGEVGRFYVKGKTVTEGYWNNHSKTYKETLDRWFFTGDVVRQESDGNIIQLDREVDVIHTNEGDVYSLLIEEIVHQHDAIFDSCVYGARQSDRSQLPAAIVALNSGVDLTEEEILGQLNLTLEGVNKLVGLKIIPWRDFSIGLTGKTLKRTYRDNTETGPLVEDNRPVGA